MAEKAIKIKPTNSIRSIDIGKLDDFEKESKKAIEEFAKLKTRFEEINSTLLSKWQGQGADQYEKETKDIFSKIGSLEDNLNSVNEALKTTKDTFNKLDEELGKHNEHPISMIQKVIGEGVIHNISRPKVLY